MIGGGGGVAIPFPSLLRWKIGRDEGLSPRDRVATARSAFAVRTATGVVVAAAALAIAPVVASSSAFRCGTIAATIVVVVVVVVVVNVTAASNLERDGFPIIRGERGRNHGCDNHQRHGGGCWRLSDTQRILSPLLLLLFDRDVFLSHRGIVPKYQLRIKK